MSTDEDQVTAFVVPVKDVKNVKMALELHKLLNKHVKIVPFASRSGHMQVPTTICKLGTGSTTRSVSGLLSQEEQICINDLWERHESTLITVPKSANHQSTNNIWHRAVREALWDVSDGILDYAGTTRDELLASLPPAHSIYSPMLLLPHTILDQECWEALLLWCECEYDHALEAFYDVIAEKTATTHIAINAPIPTEAATMTGIPDDPKLDISMSNVLRSPSNLMMLHGDFGPPLPPFPQHTPSDQDFGQAFWVSTMQNGIKQTWAPRYTMFSKGNVTEKARLLTLESVASLRRTPWTAVDLFAGIGYFAFSYASAGASQVLCWDLNPWSIEGLRRGAVMNKWTVGSGLDMSAAAATLHNGSNKLLVFCESNANALKRVEARRSLMPPVRHVNCGMLPDLGQAWQTAVYCLDWELGGWLHLHETSQESQVAERAETMRHDIERLLHGLMEGIHGPSHRGLSASKKQVSIDHIEKVKSVGPRMVHIVVDIHITGSD